MLSLEISSIGSACNKNPYESRDKTIFTQLCKEQSLKYRNILIEQGIIQKGERNHSEEEFNRVYKKFKSEIRNPNDFSKMEEKIVSEFKTKEPKTDTTNFVEKMRSDFKKDCGINNESSIISSKKYNKGNNKMWRFKSELGWELRGFHDASDGDLVIEIKTRMKKNNIRKNKYDLYQLFGYLLAMNKTKGKIVQMYNNEIFSSDVENKDEYGIVDIHSERFYREFEIFKQELNEFFEEVNYYKDKIFDINSVFGKLTRPIAIYSDQGVNDILPGFEKIVNLIT